MKINFDDLFKEDPPTRIDPFLFNTTSPLDSTHKTQNLNSTMQTQDATPSIHRELEVQDYESVKRILQLKIALALQEQTEQYRVPKPVIQLLNRKKVDIVELTNKMYQHVGCSKKQCFEYKLQKVVKDKEEQQSLKQAFQSRKTSKNSDYETSSTAHERLYNFAKVKQQKRLGLIERYQEQRKQAFEKKQAFKVSKYLKNYVPFYNRLEEEVRRSTQKYKMITKYSEYIQGTETKYFKPTKISKRYAEIPSRYDKPLTCRDNYSYVDVHSSFNTSLMSVMSLDKSIELVNNVQEYFFSKMLCIFVDENQQSIRISQRKIQLLTDCQFKIIQSFIKELQTKEVKSSQFQSRLRCFYNNLNFADKQQLRTHMRKAKQLERSQKNLGKSTQSCAKLNETKMRKRKGSRDTGDYQKMTDYV